MQDCTAVRPAQLCAQPVSRREAEQEGGAGGEQEMEAVPPVLYQYTG